MFSVRTSQFIDKRIGENDKGLSQEEKYSKRLKVVRKRLNKRASKFALDSESTDLTHFGKRLNDMSKTELRNAYIGSEDDESGEPFSYDGLIAKSKEERAASRRQKMEAEAELEDLDVSFAGVLSKLARRDIETDKLANGSFNEDDDLAAMARSFQMDNIKKAQAGDRSLTQGEKQEQLNQLIRKSAEARNAAADDDYEEEETEGDVVVESETSDIGEDVSSEQPQQDGFFGLVNECISHPSRISHLRSQLIDAARSSSPADIATYFKTNLFDSHEDMVGDLSRNDLLLVKLVSILFPLDHLRHPIAVPTLKLLEHACLHSSAADIGHLSLLSDFLKRGSKYSPAFFSLAGRLYREANNESSRSVILELCGEVCSQFTRESLFGPLSYFFPELLELVSSDKEPFVPLRLHHFKPVEVVSLEPAFHEDGSEWNGQHREIREAKRMERQYKQEKKLTVKEMRREAAATESFHAIQKKREREKAEESRKRAESKMQQAEQNWRLTKTDQGKEDKRKMRSKKKSRRS